MKHRFLVLDMFRGIFASLVVLYHMSAFSDTPVLNNSFILNADMFVDFFFVLSGFVICYSYQSINSLTELKLFLTKRIRRLYPLHLLMLLIFLAIEGVKLGLVNHIHINNFLDNSPTTFFSSLFLINSIKLPHVHDVSWNLVSWSISAEVISYIIFALSCHLSSTNRGNALKPMFYMFIALLAAILLYTITGSFKLDYTYDYGFLRGLIGFFSGACCLYCFKYLHERLSDFRQSLFSFMEIGVLLLIGMAIISGPVLKPYGFIYEIVFFISIMVFSFEKGLVSKAISKIGLLKKLGKYSYSIYMVHTLFISMFNVIFIRVFKLPESAYAYLFIPNCIVIYYAARWTYQHIEMRFQYKSKKSVTAG
ncbi:acyltransferase [Pedobacter psychrodurus]|uniref:Acyltransferase n=1 Tax=Pedobacter psychrodurus TaxID=2530456 RepID=A0A4R0PQE2_9SPHI|nr:acyltransferase [Pedobacter psychrodurus]TCD23406.1 acyltransferase [Pedobacter psychrodurus]